MLTESTRSTRYVFLTLLFLASVIALSPGIGEITGITAKDEYHLALRIPLSMMEQNEWIVPHLDGVPRVKKPPMINWLTRASFEIFGVSLTSARMVNVMFAALFVLVVALIGFEYTGDLRYGLSAGLITLSTIGLAILSKFLLLDVPTAAFGALAFYWFQKWSKTLQRSYLAGIAVSLSAGFLTKGPVVLIIFGSGVVALLVTTRVIRLQVWQNKGAIFGSLLLFLGLTAPWFVYVYFLYPDYTFSILQREVAARNFGNLSVMPVIGAAIVAFPWTFVLINVLISPRSFASNLPEARHRKVMLIIWLGLSIVPFLLIKTFERYVIGSLIPIALLCATAIETGDKRAVRFSTRVGMIVTCFLVLFSAAFAMWFKTSGSEVFIVLMALGIFGFVWWQSTKALPMALSATVLWMALIGFLYPTLGINAIPSRIFDKVEGRRVILYRDQQPSLLPIKMGRSLEVTGVLTQTDFASEDGRTPLIFAKEGDAADLEDTLKALGVDFKQIDSYKTLSSRVAWIRFARKGATVSDWILAVQNRTLDPIKLTIFLYDVKPLSRS